MDRTETTGLGISVVGHGALLAILTYGLFKAAAPLPPSPAMEVSFVDEAGLTSAAPEPATEAPAIGAAPDVGPVEDAAPVPEPRPMPTQAPVAPRRATLPPQRPSTRSRATRPITADILKGIGNDPVSRSDRAPARMTGEQRASVRSLIARALMRCQRQPLPAPEAAAIRVDYRVSLNRDGSLASAEFVRVLNDNPALEKYERRMRDLALNVINACTPIRGLPAEFYDVPNGWRQFPYQFDPRTGR